ncbi:MAG TPA: hypothetical protein PK970_00605 [Hyphomicrobiaceae bacterium]|nr:hypothetical protein [Hyphomicrobiaceae bacterium]
MSFLPDAANLTILCDFDAHPPAGRHLAVGDRTHFHAFSHVDLIPPQAAGLAYVQAPLATHWLMRAAWFA